MINHDASALSLATISSFDLVHVTGGATPPVPGESGPAAEPAPQQSWGQTAWQGVKDFSGGFVAGATTGKRADQPWGDSSSRASKAGGETGVMMFGRTGRPR